VKIILTYGLLVVLAAGCSKPILLREIGLNKKGVVSYGNSLEQKFYYDINISTDLKFNWKTQTQGSFGTASLIVYDKYIFASDLAGRVYCFSDSSGKEIGELKHKGEIAVSPVLAKDKLIYAVNNYKEKYSTLYYYFFKQGEFYKEIRIDGNCTNQIISSENGIILLTQNGIIYSFNLIGDLEWKLITNKLTYSSPLLYNNSILFNSLSGDLIIVDVKTRKIKTQKKLSTSFESNLIVNGSTVFMGDTEGNIFCYDYIKDKINWIQSTGAKIVSEPVIDNKGFIYVGNLAGDLFCFEVENGKTIWEFKTNGVFRTAPIIFKNVLIQSDLDKKLLIINCSTGRIEKQIDFDRRVKTQPLYYKNKIYVGVDKGEIFSYQVEKL